MRRCGLNPAIILRNCSLLFIFLENDLRILIARNPPSNKKVLLNTFVKPFNYKSNWPVGKHDKIHMLQAEIIEAVEQRTRPKASKPGGISNRPSIRSRRRY